MASGDPQYVDEAWEDVTERYQDLTHRLPPERIMGVEGFQLENVMHAIEVMDAKMDCGVGYQNRRTRQEVLESGDVKSNPTELEVRALMRFLFKAEASYLSGQLLPCNMLLCIYFHRRELVAEHPILRSYMQALCVSIHTTNNLILVGDVAEQEEFVALTYSVDYCELVTPGEAATALEQTLGAYRKAGKERLEKEGRTAFSAEEEAMRKEIIFYIEFRILYLRLAANLASRQLKKAEKSLAQWSEKMQAVREAKLLPEETSTVRPSGASPAAAPPPPQHTKDDPLLEGMVFLEACAWLAPSVPHPPVLPNLSETLSLFETLAEEHQELCRVEEKCTSLATLVDYTETFSARKPQPHLVSRSRLMLLLYEKNLILKKHKLTDMIVKHLAEDLGAPLYASLLSDPLTMSNLPAVAIVEEGRLYQGTSIEGHRPNQAQLKEFLEAFQKCILNYLHSLLHNRARLRRKIANLFVDWGWLQGTAWEVDQYVFDGGLILDKGVPDEVAQRTIVLSGMVFDFVLSCMSLFLNLGFELELFTNTEIRQMLWYAEYVGVVRVENMKQLYKARALPREALQQLKRYRKVKSNDPAAILPPVYHTRQIVEIPQVPLMTLEITGVLQKGLVLLCGVLEDTNILRDTGSRAKREKYCSKDTRYGYRLQPFMHLMKPAFASYDTYKREATVTKEIPAILADAKTCFDHSTKGVTYLITKLADEMTPRQAERVNELRMVSKANGLSLLLVHRAIDEAQQKPSAGEEVTPSSRAVLDWTYSKSLPVVKIEKAKV